MKCPICDDTALREMEKDGILIDVCPTCKGVWLDRGELDKLMRDVREARDEYNDWYYGDSRQPPQPGYDDDRYRDDRDRDGRYDDRKHQGHPPYRKKKRSVMDVFGDLFD